MQTLIFQCDANRVLESLRKNNVVFAQGDETGIRDICSVAGGYRNTDVSIQYDDMFISFVLNTDEVKRYNRLRKVAETSKFMFTGGWDKDDKSITQFVVTIVVPMKPEVFVPQTENNMADTQTTPLATPVAPAAPAAPATPVPPAPPAPPAAVPSASDMSQWMAQMSAMAQAAAAATQAAAGHATTAQTAATSAAASATAAATSATAAQAAEVKILSAISEEDKKRMASIAASVQATNLQPSAKKEEPRFLDTTTGKIALYGGGAVALVAVGYAVYTVATGSKSSA